jgi:hypothetical protein
MTLMALCLLYIMSSIFQTSMITTEGDLIEGHTVKLSLGDDLRWFFHATVKKLQKLFFLILKTLS